MPALTRVCEDYVCGCLWVLQTARRGRESDPAFLISRQFDLSLELSSEPSRSSTDYMWIARIVNAERRYELTQIAICAT